MKKELSLLPRGRPLMLRLLDEMVKNYISEYRSGGGPVNSIFTISIAKALIARNLQFNLEHINLDSSSWAKSLFKRIRLTQRMKTTGKRG